MNVLLVSINHSFYGQSDSTQQKTFKQKLYEKYTKEELENMGHEELMNAVDRIEGNKLSYPEETEPTHDKYGIKLIDSVNKVKQTKEIRAIFKTIEQRRVDYRKEVFPNTYIDVMNHEFNFYEDILERSLSFENYKTFDNSFDWGGIDVRSFKNRSRRIYYFNESNDLRLIVIEYGNNVNKGKFYDIIKNSRIDYSYEAYYIRNDSLKFKYSFSGIQDYPVSMKIWREGVDLDTVPVTCEAHRKYFYKNNCFKHLVKKGEFDHEKWRDALSKQQNKKADDCSNKPVIELRNHIWEYNNRDSVDYLESTPNSFIKDPYTVPPGEKVHDFKY